MPFQPTGQIFLRAEYRPDFDSFAEDQDVPDLLLPSKFVVCYGCEGRGKIVNPSIDGNGLSREDFDNDPEFREDYFKGVYDIACPECGGLRVVPEIDRELCAPELLEAYDRWQEDELAYARERANEIRWGY